MTASGTQLNEAFQRDIPDLGPVVSALCFCFWWTLSAVPWLHFQIFLELVLLLQQKGGQKELYHSQCSREEADTMKRQTVLMPVVPALMRLRQDDYCKFKTSLGHWESSRLTWARVKPYLQNKTRGWERAQQLCLLLLKWTRGHFPNTHIRLLTITFNSNSKRSHALFWPPTGTHTHISIKKNNKF